ncbi:cupin domain-containing protein [Sinirhodobacter sp. WL0062]|uniref:Cupin domain-containing protein n=1 Tax=Rhodobacter flavimaris TaxID=2907145 RepID=A0ABS8YTB7_9RHOB|nr:cupin domain-containing protein [Sinirhodobacter sp. WL0062]MCE5973109.1 cupin domain-containing protein [Sinirhodobacter sp. WL0062]
MTEIAAREPQFFSTLLDGGWRDFTFRHFRDGVEIATLMDGEPGVALLRYAPGAGVPRHRHTGLETILVLEGVQSDERGDYPAGSLILNPEGTVHSVWSQPGCIVLIQWNRPVEFLI